MAIPSILYNSMKHEFSQQKTKKEPNRGDETAKKIQESQVVQGEME